jgi:alpha-D-ribose 1-methylphosphonate 5-triphosphate synthase subunit PhnG
MDDPTDRTDRFELVARAAAETLADLANDVLATDPAFAVRQEPRPQLLLQQVREPVERRRFNLGEVVVTPAEVELDGARGYAVYPGKAERAALSGAVVDAAVAAGHDSREAICEALRDVAEARETARAREWGERLETRVEFETMEGED